MHHVVERHWVITAHAGGDTFLQFFERHRGNGGNIELAGLVDRYPHEFDEFRLRPDKSLGAMNHRRYVSGEETAVKAPRPPWWRDRPKDKMDRA